MRLLLIKYLGKQGIFVFYRTYLVFIIIIVILYDYDRYL